MKIVIMSDMHDNQINLKKCLNWCRKENIKKIICCGDVANKETIKLLAGDGGINIYLVKGNAELYEEIELKQYKNINYQEKIGVFKIDGKWVGVCHEPYLIEKVLEKNDCEIIFYGHTHKPWIQKKNGVQTVNPGALGGGLILPTFAFWDTKTGALELKIIDKL